MAPKGRQPPRASWWSWVIVAAAISMIAVWTVLRTRAGLRERSVLEQQRQLLSEPLSMESHGDRLMPRLAPPDFRAGLPKDADPPHTAVESLGLEILYVLDAEHSVRYLTEADLEQLGLTGDELHECAMGNLRKTLSGEVVRSASEARKLVAIKSLDSYDATRLLLLPEHLKPGEELAAVIPDRDTLTFVAVWPDFDWPEFGELAKIPVSDKTLLTRPVRVTHEGFELK
jgi:hypothetical protein